MPKLGGMVVFVGVFGDQVGYEAVDGAGDLLGSVILLSAGHCCIVLGVVVVELAGSSCNMPITSSNSLPSLAFP